MKKTPLLFTLAVLGCSTPAEYKADADREVYALIDARREALFARDAGFNIEPDEDSLRQRVLDGRVDDLEALTLTQCLEIAAENSREFQAAKESLYRSALSLTLAKWQFTSIWSLDGGANSNGDAAGGENSSSVDADLGMRRLLGTGATVISNIGAGLFKAVNTGDGWEAVSDVGLSVTQPLLRGAAREVVREPLTQAERNLVYAVRDYEGFRRDFVLSIVSSYYDILLTTDRLKNERANFETLSDITRYEQRQFDAGRKSSQDLDEAEQRRLASESSLLVLEQSLARQIDNFKITLGLPVDLTLTLDPAALTEIGALAGDDVLGLDRDQVVALGLQRRLDLLNSLDALIDAERRVRIAEDALRAGLDLSGSVNATSNAGEPLTFDNENITWAFSIGFDLPIDNLDDRNAYRRSVIDLQVALRSAEALNDRITADLADSLRVTRTAKDTYEISLLTVEINERRVRSTAMNLEAGRETDTFSLLRAQEDLLAAQNSATSALLAFAIARLNLYRDLELLDFTEEGIALDEESLPVPPAEAAPDAEGDPAAEEDQP